MAADHSNQIALMIAAKGGHSECMQQLLAHMPAWQVSVDKEGSKALMIASLHGHAECMEALLAPDVQIWADDFNGKTALMHAACHGGARCVALLLEHVPVVQTKQNSNMLTASVCGQTGVDQTLALAPVCARMCI